MCVRDEVVEELARHTDSFMPRMSQSHSPETFPHPASLMPFCAVWTDPCNSWYKNGKKNGRVTALWVSRFLRKEFLWTDRSRSN